MVSAKFRSVYVPKETYPNLWCFRLKQYIITYLQFAAKYCNTSFIYTRSLQNVKGIFRGTILKKCRCSVWLLIAYTWDISIVVRWTIQSIQSSIELYQESSVLNFIPIMLTRTNLIDNSQKLSLIMHNILNFDFTI